MVTYREWMAIGLAQCTGPNMSQRQRKEVFSSLAAGWSREKDRIKQMTKQEVRKSIECP